MLSDLHGLRQIVRAGEIFSIRLESAAQIVNVFAFNLSDPDERIWQQTITRDGLFLKPYGRVWGTMARYRPLMTVLRDSVTTKPGPLPFAQHHLVLGGSGTPMDWREAGGPAGVKTTWEQFNDLLLELDLPVHLLKENLCLFQKTAIAPPRQQLKMVPSDAVKGDEIVLFAEIDLIILLALSPYIDGSTPPSAMQSIAPRPVSLNVTAKIAEPLGWPYNGIPYPDLSPYLNDHGVRSEGAVEG